MRQGPISKLVTGAVGLTQEYRADRAERKAREKEQQQQQHAHDSSDDEDAAEDYDWAVDLDEAQDAISPQKDDQHGQNHQTCQVCVQ